MFLIAQSSRRDYEETNSGYAEGIPVGQPPSRRQHKRSNPQQSGKNLEFMN